MGVSSDKSGSSASAATAASMSAPKSKAGLEGAVQHKDSSPEHT
jgi:hypothetical protein